MVRCGMVGFGDSTLDFELTFDLHGADFDKLFAARARICVAILEAFEKAGIQFAYPTQTAFTAAPDGTLIMPYPAPDEEQPAMKSARRAKKAQAKAG